jgi:hypothetical protein
MCCLSAAFSYLDCSNIPEAPCSGLLNLRELCFEPHCIISAALPVLQVMAVTLRKFVSNRTLGGCLLCVYIHACAFLKYF